MTPQQFISKWQNSTLKERAAAHEHFIDLCRMLGEPTPAEVDPTGKDYGFEVGASKTTGGNGFADVFKRGFFGWEYKGTKANLDTAFAQLQRYAIALDNPPLLIVSDIGTTIRIHTNWTNSVSKVYAIGIDELVESEKRAWLKAALSDPDALRPTKTRQELTEEVAGEFARLARSLRERGHVAEVVAHFINRLVFCMFAEDVRLLPDMIFSRMLDRALEDPKEFQSFARDLFAAMKAGGRIGFERVAWFNGGLFDDDTAFDLTRDEIKIVRNAASYHWGDVDPSILGTLFERGLDPDKRSQLGAHYTDREKIMMIVRPVVVEPLSAEWEKAKAEIATLMEKAAKTKGAPATRARGQAQMVLDRHLARLANFRVLDPACGSGNFLYLALRALKDLEHRAQVEAEALGLPRGFPRIGPEVVKGIELNSYAAELARVSVWIGEIQWMIANGFAASQNPILKPLETIECRDAVLNSDGSRAEWPDAEVIVGNPPFLGSKFHRKGRPATKTKPALKGLGDEYADQLYAAYSDIVPASADLVSYWFAKAGILAEAGRLSALGLIATKSIGKGASNQPLSWLVTHTDFRIFSASRNEPWVVDGAEVRVAIVCAKRSPTEFDLDGQPSGAINPDLTTGLDISKARPVSENRGVAFQGVKLNGPFEISDTFARSLLKEPTNPNGKTNSEVVRRFAGNDDVTMRDCDAWVIDFTAYPKFSDAALFEKPFQHVQTEVAKHRQTREVGKATEVDRLEMYWLMQRPRPNLRSAAAKFGRVIAVPETSEHLIFRYRPSAYVFSGSLFAICRDDDVAFGILSSRIHAVWARAHGNQLGVGNQGRYNATRTFLTFPFPAGLTPNIPAADYAGDPRAVAIAEAASRLNELRENWLDPADLVRREPEIVSGYPDRVLPVNEAASKELAKRTLTNLYNQRPAWLDIAHRSLDEAVASAYGWPADLSDNEVLERLFALNQERAAR
jgi:hypothetical protein